MAPPEPVHRYLVRLVGAARTTTFTASVCRAQDGDYVFFDRDGNEVHRFAKTSVQSMTVN